MKLLSNESGKNTTKLNGARLHEEKNETTPLPNENLNALQKWSNTQGNLQGGGGGGYSTGIWVVGFGRLNGTLTLFKTHKFEFCYPV